MPKFRVPVERLPASNVNGRQLFRFRVLSEDRNRQSQYSPLFTIESKGQIYPLQTTATVSASGGVILVYWQIPSVYNVGASAVGASVQHNHGSELRVHETDIFISWNGEAFTYYGRTNDSSIAIVKPSGSFTNIRVIGQVANYPPTRSDLFKIFDTGTRAIT